MNNRDLRRRIPLILILYFSFTISSEIIAQTTLYTQDFGTGTSFPSGWSASSTTTWTISTSTSSSGYTGASGGSNAASPNNSSERILTYASVNTTGYANITVLWGARRATTAVLTFEWSTNNSTWIPLNFTDVTNNSTWALVNNGNRIGVPVANVSTLYFRWRITNAGSGGYRIDDFSVEGTLISLGTACSGTPAPGNTLSTPNPVCYGSPYTLSLQNATSGAGVTYQWQSSPDNSTWTNLTPVFITSDFSSQPANTNVYGDATVTGGVLRLTRNVGSLTGGFVIQTTPGSNITPFTATFDYRIFDGTGADGMSLSYGPDINDDAGPGEPGEGSGIILMFDTYDNTGGTNPNSQIRINYAGSQIWNNTIGAFNLRSTDYRTIRVTADNNGYLTLTIAGTMIVNGLLLPGYAVADKTNWRFKFSARTGGATDLHTIDNLTIQMGDATTYYVASGTTSTYYQCRVTCATTPATGISTSIQVTVDPELFAVVAGRTNVSCSGGADGTITIFASGGTGPYQFSVDNGGSYTSGSNPCIIGGLNATTSYYIRVKDNYGCESPEIQ